MRLDAATQIAKGLVWQMRLHCERIEIAGSIRRRKPEVKDIEIVAVPKWVMAGSLLFEDTPALQNRLLQWAFDAEAVGNVQWIKPGTHEIIPWEPKRDGKYWRGLLKASSLSSEGIREVHIKLDLFLATPENFGLIYLIRTGSAEFSEAVVTHAKRIGKRCVGGHLETSDGEVIDTREEGDVFAALNLAFVEPERRINARSLKARQLGASQTKGT